MDRHLQDIVIRGDREAFVALVDEQLQAGNGGVIAQTTFGSANTVLHLAARFGHSDLAAEILRLRPDLAAAENKAMETPLHEAAREGWEAVVRLLVESAESHLWVYKVNCRGESCLFAACERGWVSVVRFLIATYPWLLMLELDHGLASTTSLHVSASAGHTEVFKEVLRARPDFARRTDLAGYTPLHLSCSKGHLEITRELLRLDPDLSLLQDNEGRTPLHLAAARGRVNVIDEILLASLESTQMRTVKGETVLHLAVRNNQYETLRYLVETIDITSLVNLADDDGNTVLHLATVGKLNAMVVYLLKLGVDVNAINRRGHTPLDVIEADASNSGALVIHPALIEAGAKRCSQLPPDSPEIMQQRVDSPPFGPRRPHDSLSGPRPRRHHHRHHKRRREKHKELHDEGLRNARNTITVVAVLIATVTFAAGINPPGGFDQHNGIALLGRQVSFKIFMVCNIVALFLSLGIVIFLVSIIPFKRKSMMKLLVITHKVMWVSVSFMAAAYIAAIWSTLPRRRGDLWVLASVLSIGCGCTLAIFVGLGVLLARHWLKKLEWRRKKQKNKDGSPSSSVSRVEEMNMMKRRSHESTTNSDIDSSDQGYILY